MLNSFSEKELYTISNITGRDLVPTQLQRLIDEGSTYISPNNRKQDSDRSDNDNEKESDV